MLCFCGAIYFWRLGNEWAAKKNPAPPAATTNSSKATNPNPTRSVQPQVANPRLLSQGPDSNSTPTSSGSVKSTPARAAASVVPATNNVAARLRYRLSNSTRSVAELARSDKAVLLENALLDTTQPGLPQIPEHLRIKGDPGSYIIQAPGPIDASFRALLKAAGAEVVAYVPNNAFLVRASAAVAQALGGQPEVQAILPYEPYYKLKGVLLQAAVKQTAVDAPLNLLLFQDAQASTRAALEQMGAQVLAEDRSPFGPVLKVSAPADSVAALAALTGVQEIELARMRVPANDLSRPTIGVAVDPTTGSNYLGLTGSKITVAVADTGIDGRHPDLTGRVLFDPNATNVDYNGHGTHVAGIIAGNGISSPTVSNASGSILLAGTNYPVGQFRGMATNATLFGLMADPFFGADFSDSYLQETVASQTNIFISNNSWNYADISQYNAQAASYDLGAASYDAAVRDALPLVTGPQPLLFVFAAGDDGGGLDDGSQGAPDTILSPATAKNVITVGAVEQLRNITNEVVAGGQTNAIWQLETDSTNEVAPFSSRGNVGIGIEGLFGRFKPDLVAPGVFVVSTRSGQWDEAAYYTFHEYLHARLLLAPNESWQNVFVVPTNATQVVVRLVNRRSPVPPPDLPVGVGQLGSALTLGTNYVAFTNPPANATFVASVTNTSRRTVAIGLVAEILTLDPTDDRFTVLSNMNSQLGKYRYESGTSMAAADVSGTLALMQEFLENPSRKPGPRTDGWGGVQGRSPALMKAMLINGARSLGNAYNLQVENPMNFQGWGMLRLPTSLHGGLADETQATNSMWLFDQDPTNAVATGETQIYHVRVNEAAMGSPLRITLVWSDPPGNPVTAMKLVNDLDLVLTNIDSVASGPTNALIYFGNDIGSSADFNFPWDFTDTNTLPKVDFVNNVENIFIPPPLATNYDIAIIGHRVNVNAVPENPDNVVQDYALVVSCGEGDLTNAVSVTLDPNRLRANVPFITGLTNTYAGSSNYFGQTLQNQRAGASSPLLGTNSITLPSYGNAIITLGVTNQWHFYLIENTSGFTNARFVISSPRNLSIPRMGVDVLVDTNATRVEADVDLYVSLSNGLLQLDPIAVSNADKAIGRDGSAVLVISNAQQTFYYIGVKAEDQMAAEYTIQVLFSLLPFSLNNNNGALLNWIEPFAIPDGTPQHPGITNVTLGPADPSMLVRRVIVSNNVSHELFGDLVGALSYPDGNLAVLNNHSAWATVTNQWFIYDDSDEGDVFAWPGAVVRHSDGPGSLQNFAGKHLGQLFTFNMEDNALGHIGVDNAVFVFLEKQPPLTGGIVVSIPPGHCRQDFIEVPPQAVSMTIEASIISGTGPVSIEVCKTGPTGPCTTNYNVGSGVSVTLDQFTDPPLTPGTYVVRTCNNGPDAARVYIIAKLEYVFNRFQTSSFSTNPIAPILDDAVTYSSIIVTNHMTISSLNVGLLITNLLPRMSDMAITLISPSGQRILLFEDRGGSNAYTLGTGDFNAAYNGIPYTNMVPFHTNDFDDVATGPYAPGAVFDGWNVLSNYVTVYPEMPAPWLSNNVLVLGYGAVSNNLPVTNATAYPLPLTSSTTYQLDFRVAHTPYLAGTVGWWPFDGDASDIFGGFNGLLAGDVSWNSSTGEVNQAFFGDGIATRMVVPRCPALDVGKGRGFTVEGWIRPQNLGTNLVLGETVLSDGFEVATQQWPVLTGSTISGWLVESGDVDVITTGQLGPTFIGPADSGTNYVDINGRTAGTLSRNVSLQPGTRYQLSFAYTRNPDSVTSGIVPQAAVLLNGATLATVTVSWLNTWPNPAWGHTSVVFTASAAVSKLQLQSLTQGSTGVMFDSISINALVPAAAASPLAEWNDIEQITGIAVGPSSPVPLQNATALWSQTASGDFSVYRASDSVTNDNLGWANQFTPFGSNICAFETATNIGFPNGSLLTFTLCQYGYWTYHPDTLGRFRISVTTADRSTYCDGISRSGNVGTNWTVLQPASFVSLGGATLRALGDNSILASGAAPDRDVYIVKAYTTLTNITGVRLEALQDPSLPYYGPGREPPNGNFILSEFQVNVAPLIQVTYPGAQGVQLWQGDLSTNLARPSVLSAALWDTNSQPHYIVSGLNALTNNGWQHVALTYDAPTMLARLYTNGQLAVLKLMSPSNTFVPRTTGDLYFGYHPDPSSNFVAFAGGLDEFGLYERALSDCEISAIFQAGIGGKYGTNVLWCPLTNTASGSSVTAKLTTDLGGGTKLTTSYFFTNGVTITNNPGWETNSIVFPNLLLSATTNGPATNFTSLVLANADPNLSISELTLSALVTNTYSGAMHFTEDTNVALLPIKFGSVPYAVSNTLPRLIFTNDFETVTQTTLFAAGKVIPGSPGSTGWVVTNGSVTVISNTPTDALGTNYVALATAGLNCTLPTLPGRRYQLTYTVRGPGAVSWWSGDVEPLSQRAWDLLGGNNGAFLHRATNSPTGLVRTNCLVFPGLDPTNNVASKIEVGDPANLRLTNGFTIEGWIRPATRPNTPAETLEQLLFRGDSRDCLEPYYFGVERVTADRLDLVFHIEDEQTGDCGIILETAKQPVQAGVWQHVAAVFDSNVPWTNNAPWPTNELRLYYNGQQLLPEKGDVFIEDPLSAGLYTEYTGRFPFRDLDPAFSPGVSIGARSRQDNSEPFYGAIDELSVYGRALTGPEIAAIAAAGPTGKADFFVSPAQSLAKLSVSIDGVERDRVFADNSRWATHTLVFNALQTNSVLTLQSLLPGTLVDGITVTELPSELDYQPETSLDALAGQDAFGTWQLEIWDTRSESYISTNLLPVLVDWRLDFQLLPANVPPVVDLVHGIAYTNSLVPHGMQYFMVDTPQWATMATNSLLSAVRYNTTNPLPVTVLYDTNAFPVLTSYAFWPPTNVSTTVLATNTVPWLNLGQRYYLAVTNPNDISVTFALGVWFDLLSLTNCQPLTNFVWQAGIPRYFQMDVPAYAVPPGAPPQEVAFWLTGVYSNYTGIRSNLTMVMSQHLPLPDLTHFDYSSSNPCTNDDVILVLTNSTPFPIQTNRWYVGIFNQAQTNVPFTLQACYSNAYPVIVPLTNGVAFAAGFTSPFVAPPGPPEWFYFQFQLTNFTDAILFELYNLSGNADLVLQREVPPTMAPYFDGSFADGMNPEQIVLRRSFDVPDLRGNWYLGIYNNESTNVAYTLRAVVSSGGMLLSAQALVYSFTPLAPPLAGLLMQWNSIIGEYYAIESAPLAGTTNWIAHDIVQATTPLSTYVVPDQTYRARQISPNEVLHAPLTIKLWTNGLVRLSWPTSFPGKTLQYALSLGGPWANVNRPVVIEGNEFVVYDVIGSARRFYRLVP